jgi:DNA repair protein RecO (recombination protein O)
MLEKTEGLVLKTVRFSESSVIVRIFTREKGWLNFHVPGVRSSRNKSKGNLFQPLQYLELDIYHHPTKQLLKIKEHRPAYIYAQLPYNIINHSIAVFCLEVITKCLHENEANSELYDFCRSFLIELDQQVSPDSMKPQKFLLALCKILGFVPLLPKSDDDELYFHLQDGRFEPFPDNLGPTLEQDHTAILLRFLRADPRPFNNNERNILTDSLLAYFRTHVPGFGKLNSTDILRQIIR